MTDKNIYSNIRPPFHIEEGHILGAEFSDSSMSDNAKIMYQWYILM